jgi:signal recognition particle GTPase
MDDMPMTELLTTRIDEALEQYRGRDLVAASEITDLLLDLRLMLLAADEEARTTAS